MTPNLTEPDCRALLDWAIQRHRNQFGVNPLRIALHPAVVRQLEALAAEDKVMQTTYPDGKPPHHYYRRVRIWPDVNAEYPYLVTPYNTVEYL